jgi:DNA-binding transcriptional ArsR family regulator
MSCVTQGTVVRSRRVRYCSRSHARWAKPGPETCRGARSSRAPSGRSTPMNRIARGCGSKSGGFAVALRTLADVSATKRGFALAPRRAREVVVLAPPVEEQHAAVLAFLADGESWSSSALALALGASQRTVQRALDSLAAAGKVQSFGRGRARRWMTPPVPGFPTTCYSPVRCRAIRMEA